MLGSDSMMAALSTALPCFAGRRGAPALFAAFVLVVGATTSDAIGAESAEFKQAKPGLRSQLRNRAGEKRIEAIRELSEFKDLAAAKLILQSASKDPDDDVRAAARLALLEYKNDDQLCEQFATLVGKDTRKKFPAEGTMALAEVLLCSDSEQWRSAALDYLELAILPSRQGSLMLFALAEELNANDGIAGLMRLGKSAVFDKSFPLRRVMVQMLAESRKPDAVAP